MAEQLSAEQSFKRLYERNSAKVMAYCVRRLGHDLAQDALAETFLVAWRRSADIPEGDGELPYLYRIAGNVVSNLRRSGRRRVRLEAKLRGAGIEMGLDASTYVLRSEQNRQVVGAVEQLRPKDREILMLYLWEELPRETIAAMMGLSKQAVDQRIHRAYKRLGRLLAPAEDRSAILPRVAKKGGET